MHIDKEHEIPFGCCACEKFRKLDIFVIFLFLVIQIWGAKICKSIFYMAQCMTYSRHDHKGCTFVNFFRNKQIWQNCTSFLLWLHQIRHQHPLDSVSWVLERYNCATCGRCVKWVAQVQLCEWPAGFLACQVQGQVKVLCHPSVCNSHLPELLIIQMLSKELHILEFFWHSISHPVCPVRFW